MRLYRADLHIHTVLSPCGDLEMSPVNIIKEAKRKQLDIIGITDHNSTKNCQVTKKIGERNNISVLMGTEITTKEEVHCLAFFETEEELAEFQNFLSEKLPSIPNDVKYFGYQLVVNEKEEILEEEEKLLISGLEANIHTIEKKVHGLNGIFIPAHINKQKYSLISQLGFVPPNLEYEALEISRHITKDKFLEENNYLENSTFVQNSDAHYLKDIGIIDTQFFIDKPSFDELRKALSGEEGRRVVI